MDAVSLHCQLYRSHVELADRVVCSATGQSNEKSSRRTCPKTQTKQKPKFVLLFCKEWEIQCECVGKLVNHCCVAKTTETEKKQRQPDTVEGQTGPVSTADKSFLQKHIYG